MSDEVKNECHWEVGGLNFCIFEDTGFLVFLQRITTNSCSFQHIVKIPADKYIFLQVTLLSCSLVQISYM